MPPSSSSSGSVADTGSGTGEVDEGFTVSVHENDDAENPAIISSTTTTLAADHAYDDEPGSGSGGDLEDMAASLQTESPAGEGRSENAFEKLEENVDNVMKKIGIHGQ